MLVSGLRSMDSSNVEHRLAVELSYEEFPVVNCVVLYLTSAVLEASLNI